ncbi:MAG: UDP-N-acetylmuramoyl-L-alanyl-D-glutamate--2,6-diaminopimelate ligase, partial [Lentisphaerae bacterium]|nr:UDP-N-acetylmuramoyl-L-alanyl-D-glutamate--2,6-diaminopimelate ligase [Lentisphaerota bacterium]
MKLRKILTALNPISIKGSADPEIQGITVDSRRVKQDFLFVAICGNKQDGTTFIDDALKRGAVAVVSENEPFINGSAVRVQVEDARKALASMSNIFNEFPSEKLTTIGVTGTNGKTTTSYMIRNILRRACRKPGMIGTVVYEIGDRIIPAERTTPNAADLFNYMKKMLDVGCDSVVLEVSSHAIDQNRIHGMEFDVAVFTNLTHEHLDYHHDMEHYFAAKLGLFKQLSESDKKAFAVINADDSYGRRLLDSPEIKVEKISFGSDPSAMVRIVDTQLKTNKSLFEIQSPWGDVAIELQLPGRFNISNAMASFSACAAIGIPLDMVSRALSEPLDVPGRLDHVHVASGYDVFVDYAHTADALKNVLLTLRELTQGRLIVVFGCGGDRDKTKRPLMGRTASDLADLVIVTSDNPRTEEPADIIQDILRGCPDKSDITVLSDRYEAIRFALSAARKGDIILIAGKGHENYQDFGNRVLPFDDKHVVLEYL